MTQPEVDAERTQAALEARVKTLEARLDRLASHGLSDLEAVSGSMRFGGNKQRLAADGRQSIVGVDTASKYFYDFCVSAFNNDPANALPLVGMGAYLNGTSSAQWDQNIYLSAGNYSRVFTNAVGANTVQIAGSEITRSTKVAQGYAYADATYTDGHFFVKPALFLSGLSGAPAGATSGYIWYDSTLNKLYAVINGVTTELGAAGGGMYATNPILSPTTGFNTSNPLAGVATPAIIMFTQSNSAAIANTTDSAENTFGTWGPHFDSTLNHWYIDNTTGSVCYKYFTLTSQSINPLGPLFGPLAAFDADGGAITGLPPSGLDCFVYEFRFSIATARASDTTRFVGYSNAVGSGLGAAQFGIGMYRKSGGSGWTIKSTDGTTSSDTSESSDTSNGNVHIGRLEWHAKATPEARLYIDGTLKVTKTTNLPALGATTKIQQIGLSVATGDATNDFRFYDGIWYWKNSSA